MRRSRILWPKRVSAGIGPRLPSPSIEIPRPITLHEYSEVLCETSDKPSIGLPQCRGAWYRNAPASFNYVMRHYIVAQSRRLLAAVSTAMLAPGQPFHRKCLSWVCAVKRRRFPVGVSPTRQPLQPEATGAVMEVTKWLKPLVSVSRYTVTARVCRP